MKKDPFEPWEYGEGKPPLRLRVTMWIIAVLAIAVIVGLSWLSAGGHL
jgi:hypothetical protein